MSETLWAINITGPDDLIAVSSRGEAMLVSHVMNERFMAMVGIDEEDNDPMIWAVPTVWPHTPESHADNLGDYGEYGWAKP